MTSQGKVIYLPSIYDPKKVREGILEILSLVKTQELGNSDEPTILVGKEKKVIPKDALDQWFLDQANVVCKVN